MQFGPGITIWPIGKAISNGEGGNDPYAIHWNIANEFTYIGIKTNLDSGDWLLGETDTTGAKIKFNVSAINLDLIGDGEVYKKYTLEERVKLDTIEYYAQPTNVEYVTLAEYAIPVNAHLDIISEGALIEEAVSLRHTQGTDTTLGVMVANIDLNDHRIINAADPILQTDVVNLRTLEQYALGHVIHWDQPLEIAQATPLQPNEFLVDDDLVLIEKSDSVNPEYQKRAVKISEFKLFESSSYHYDIANEFNRSPSKIGDISQSYILLEDFDDNLAKKTAKLNMVFVPGIDTDALHGNRNDEIAVLPYKSTPVASDYIVIEDSESLDPINPKKRTLIGDLPSNDFDENAIHRNIANEFENIPYANPTSGSLLIGEQEITGEKFKFSFTKIPTTHDPNAIHVNVSNEIYNLQTKHGSPLEDWLVLEEDSTKDKRKIRISSLPTGGGGEANVGENVGTGHVKIYKDKLGLALRFKTFDFASPLVATSSQGIPDTYTVSIATESLYIPAANVIETAGKRFCSIGEKILWNTAAANVAFLDGAAFLIQGELISLSGRITGNDIDIYWLQKNVEDLEDAMSKVETDIDWLLDNTVNGLAYVNPATRLVPTAFLYSLEIGNNLLRQTSWTKANPLDDNDNYLTNNLEIFRKDEPLLNRQSNVIGIKGLLTGCDNIRDTTYNVTEYKPYCNNKYTGGLNPTYVARLSTLNAPDVDINPLGVKRPIVEIKEDNQAGSKRYYLSGSWWGKNKPQTFGLNIGVPYTQAVVGTIDNNSDGLYFRKIGAAYGWISDQQSPFYDPSSPYYLRMAVGYQHLDGSDQNPNFLGLLPRLAQLIPAEPNGVSPIFHLNRTDLQNGYIDIYSMKTLQNVGDADGNAYSYKIFNSTANYLTSLFFFKIGSAFPNSAYDGRLVVAPLKFDGNPNKSEYLAIIPRKTTLKAQVGGKTLVAGYEETPFDDGQGTFEAIWTFKNLKTVGEEVQQDYAQPIIGDEGVGIGFFQIGGKPDDNRLDVRSLNLNNDDNLPKYIAFTPRKIKILPAEPSGQDIYFDENFTTFENNFEHQIKLKTFFSIPKPNIDPPVTYTNELLAPQLWGGDQIRFYQVGTAPPQLNEYANRIDIREFHFENIIQNEKYIGFTPRSINVITPFLGIPIFDKITETSWENGFTRDINLKNIENDDEDPNNIFSFSIINTIHNTEPDDFVKFYKIGTDQPDLGPFGDRVTFVYRQFNELDPQSSWYLSIIPRRTMLVKEQIQGENSWSILPTAVERTSYEGGYFDNWKIKPLLEGPGIDIDYNNDNTGIRISATGTGGVVLENLGNQLPIYYGQDQDTHHFQFQTVAVNQTDKKGLEIAQKAGFLEFGLTWGELKNFHHPPEVYPYSIDLLFDAEDIGEDTNVQYITALYCENGINSYGHYRIKFNKRIYDPQEPDGYTTGLQPHMTKIDTFPINEGEVGIEIVKRTEDYVDLLTYASIGNLYSGIGSYIFRTNPLVPNDYSVTVAVALPLYPPIETEGWTSSARVIVDDDVNYPIQYRFRRIYNCPADNTEELYNYNLVSTKHISETNDSKHIFIRGFSTKRDSAYHTKKGRFSFFGKPTLSATHNDRFFVRSFNIDWGAKRGDIYQNVLGRNKFTRFLDISNFTSLNTPLETIDFVVPTISTIKDNFNLNKNKALRYNKLTTSTTSKSAFWGTYFTDIDNPAESSVVLFREVDIKNIVVEDEILSIDVSSNWIDDDTIDIRIDPYQIHRLGIQAEPLDMGLNRITNVGIPQDNSDAVPKSMYNDLDSRLNALEAIAHPKDHDVGTDPLDEDLDLGGDEVPEKKEGAPRIVIPHKIINQADADWNTPTDGVNMKTLIDYIDAQDFVGVPQMKSWSSVSGNLYMTENDFNSYYIIAALTNFNAYLPEITSIYIGQTITFHIVNGNNEINIYTSAGQGANYNPYPFPINGLYQSYTFIANSLLQWDIISSNADQYAFHSNKNNEFNSLDLKSSPQITDLLPIEDGTDSFSKKKIPVSYPNMPWEFVDVFMDETPKFAEVGKFHECVLQSFSATYSWLYLPTVTLANRGKLIGVTLKYPYAAKVLRVAPSSGQRINGVQNYFHIRTVGHTVIFVSNGYDIWYAISSNFGGGSEEISILGDELPEYADNAAAIAGGIARNRLYRTGDVLKIVHG